MIYCIQLNSWLCKKTFLNEWWWSEQTFVRIENNYFVWAEFFGNIRTYFAHISTTSAKDYFSWICFKISMDFRFQDELEMNLRIKLVKEINLFMWKVDYFKFFLFFVPGKEFSALFHRIFSPKYRVFFFPKIDCHHFFANSNWYSANDSILINSNCYRWRTLSGFILNKSEKFRW